MKRAQAVKDLLGDIEKKQEEFTQLHDLKEFQTLYAATQKLIHEQQKQKAAKHIQADPPAGPNEIATFMRWMVSKGFKDTGLLEIKKVDEGLGLIAKADLTENQLLCEIPEATFMSQVTAAKSKLAPLLSDPLFETIPSAALALHLLIEKSNPKSFWAPYIRILPQTFNLPFFYTFEEFSLLQGSSVLLTSTRTFKAAVKQYVNVMRLLVSHPEIYSPQVFHLSDWFWAVSAVMSRQNPFPVSHGKEQKVMVALIPMFDIANHAIGRPSAGYNPETHCCEFLAMKSFKKGNQVYMYYGDRTNDEFLVYQGFVVPGHTIHDYLGIPMSINDLKLSPNLTTIKAAVCAKHGFQNTHVFEVNGDFIPIPMFNFAKLMVSDTTDPNDQEVTKNAQKYLQDKLENLMKQYNSTIEEDEIAIKAAEAKKAEQKAKSASTDREQNTINAVSMRAKEKRIIQKCINLLAVEDISKVLRDFGAAPDSEKKSKKKKNKNKKVDSETPAAEGTGTAQKVTQQ